MEHGVPNPAPVLYGTGLGTLWDGSGSCSPWDKRRNGNIKSLSNEK